MEIASRTTVIVPVTRANLTASGINRSGDFFDELRNGETIGLEERREGGTRLSGDGLAQSITHRGRKRKRVRGKKSGDGLARSGNGTAPMVETESGPNGSQFGARATRGQLDCASGPVHADSNRWGSGRWLRHRRVDSCMGPPKDDDAAPR